MNSKNSNAVYGQEWKKIFKADEKTYNEILKHITEYYRQIDDSEFATIYDCVNHALREGNHAAFAHFFLREEGDRHVIFGELLKKMIDQQKHKKGFRKGKCYTNAPILKHYYWRSIDFDFTQMNLHARTTYSSGQKGNWLKGAIPPRDVIVQVAICLSISIEDTNRLLQSAGRPALYVLDVVDACSMFTLRAYTDNFTIDPFDKLEMTKMAINSALEVCQKNNMIKIPFNEYDQYHLLGSRNPLGWDIKNEINSIKNALKNAGLDVDKEDATITSCLTKYFKNRFEESRDINEFMGTGQSVITSYRAFLQKYFGLLKKTKDFIEKAGRYEKNLKYTDWELTIEGGDEIDFRRFPLTIYGFSAPGTLPYDEALHRVEKIWYIADLVKDDGCEFSNEEEWAASDVQPDALSIPKQEIDGREREGAYEMNVGHKANLIKLAIATGNEDEVGKYLQLAGIWERDWYECIKKNEKISERLDRCDSLLLYALLYRDRLIEAWCENNGSEGLDRIKASKLHNAFPMIKLLLTINRDITLALMRLNDDYEESLKNPNLDETNTYKYEGELSTLQKEMIFPLAWHFSRKDIKAKSRQLLNEDGSGRKKDSVGIWRWHD